MARAALPPPEVFTRVRQTDIYPERIAYPGAPLNRWLIRAGYIVQEGARRSLTAAGRVNTGALRRSIYVTKPSPIGSYRDSVEVYSDKRYAIFVHRGTANNGAGRIYPQNAQALRFVPKQSRRGAGGQFQSGTIVFARSVRGQQSVPFLEDGLDALRKTPPGIL